jgi:peptide/nickel transport system permease protein
LLRLIAARLVQAAVTLAILSFVAYGLIGLMPGDPIDLAIAGDPRLSTADAAQLRALHGLDQPLWSRYLAWAGKILAGDPGFSRLFARPVTEVILPALLNTLVLLGSALLLAAVAGVGLGIIAAARPFGLRDGAINAAAFAGAAMPTFWLGILLIALFAVALGWLPAGGAGATGAEGGGFDTLRHLVLPTATLAFANLAAYARQTRAAMLGALREPFIRTARAKGATERRVLLAHAFPNAAIPVLTVAALDAGGLVSGALVTETVFAWPGMGKTIYDAILGNDYNLALLCLLLAAAVTMAASLAADLGQRALDPRLRT